MIAPPKTPSRDELEALIKEARERQLRRRLLGAAGVAIAAAIGLALYALTIGGTRPARTTADRTPGSLPSCSASRLSIDVFFQGATQMMIGGAMVTNTGGAACSLPLTRPAVRIRSHGKRVPAREYALTGPMLPAWQPASVLAPHGKAQIVMDWGRLNWCGKPMKLRPRFVLRFGNGLTLSGAASGLTLPGCGLSGSTIAVSRPLLAP
jgi:hypothetical protein